MPESANGLYQSDGMISQYMPNNGITAKQQMAFQEYLSNTALQRQMADAKAAGLNPWLMNINGASTPTGSIDHADMLAALRGNVHSGHSVVQQKEGATLKLSDFLIGTGLCNKNQALAIERFAIGLGLIPEDGYVLPDQYVSESANGGAPARTASPRIPRNYTGVWKTSYYVNGEKVSPARFDWWKMTHRGTSFYHDGKEVKNPTLKERWRGF